MIGGFMDAWLGKTDDRHRGELVAFRIWEKGDGCHKSRMEMGNEYERDLW